MNQKRIIITVNQDGTSKVDAVGFTGKTCSLATKELELALAGSPSNVDDKKRPEFYATTGGTQKLGE